jgi:hypothetical protein
MKKLIIVLLMAVHVQAIAQTGSVGIGTTSPSPAAQLDVTSITKGLLIPRMTGAQRTAIPGPVSGLLVYQNNVETSPPSSMGFYIYDAGTWKRIANASEIPAASSWTVSGNNQYSNVSGNVGIGNSSPLEKLHLTGNLQQDNGIVTLNNPAGMIQFQNTGVNKTYMQLSGDNLRLGTNSGNQFGKTIFRLAGQDRVLIDSTGNVQVLGLQDVSLTSHGFLTLGSLTGDNLIFDAQEIQARNNGNADDMVMQNEGGRLGIGVFPPKERLHVNNGNIYLSDNRNAAELNPYLIFDVPAVDYKEAGLQFKRGNDTLASIKYVAHPTLSNFIQLKASQGGSGPSLYVTNNGTGIGTADPQATLHIRKSDAEEMIRLDGLNPMIRFRKYISLFNYDDVGFLQTVNDDLRIGTFSNNTLGDFIIRTGGTDNVLVDENGDVGIGPVTNPLTKLHIQGGQDAGLSSSNNGFMMMGFATASAANLIIDNNEIMVRNGYSTAGNLTLQNNGGDLTIGARTTINKGGEALKLDGNDPAINLYDNGVQKGYVWQTGNNLQIGTSDALGKVIINTNKMQISTSVSLPDGYRLGVGGKVLCEEVRVKLQSSGWPDYVFSDEYKLMDLQDLGKFIRQNKHLPNIPAAKEIDANGLELGDMQRRLMEKIEELTLYILKQQLEIDSLKSAVHKK